jgi:pyruvate dehydrogenase E2 component (dihydrolipoamide acetyltransferase)
MRAIIAQRLQESKTTAPHFYLESEIDVGALLDLRKQLNSELAALPPEHGGFKFSVNDFILKAATEALRRVPAMNRSWAGETIRQHSSVDISFGVAIEDGLLTPVIRNAEAKSLKSISAEAKELITKARSKKLYPNEMSGSTFTVTNLGMFGVTGFYGIINTPNAGILSIGATIARPVVRDNGSIEAAQMMKIGLSCDHRVVDGATGAQFLQSLKTILENPAFIFI